MIDSNGKAIEIMMNAIPYSNQIKDIDFNYPRYIYFTWRSARYKFSLEYCSVEKSEGSVLIGDDCSMLMTSLLKRALVDKEMNNGSKSS